MNDFDALISQIGRLQDRIASLEQRHERQHRFGTAEQIDPISKRMRMRIGGTDEKPMLSPWIPYGVIAGGLYQEHTMPQVGQDSDPSPASTTDITKSGTGQDVKKGQQFSIHCPDGNFEQAYVLPFTYSNDNQAPSNDPTKIARQHVDNQKKPKKRTVKWDKAGDSQVQVNKAKHHTTEGNHHTRVNDSRDGTDSLQQELQPKEKDPKDKVHYSDTDGGKGLTRSVDNDKHKITIHPQGGIQSSVNLPEKANASEPGPSAKTTDSTHTHLLDLVKGIISSVSSNQHGSQIDPTGIIRHLVNLSKTDQPGVLGGAGSNTHGHIIDRIKGILSSVQGGTHSHSLDPLIGILSSAFSGQHSIKLGMDGITHQSSSLIKHLAPLISHLGATTISKTLNVGQLISGQGGMSVSTGSAPSFSITREGSKSSGGFGVDSLTVTKGADIGTLITIKLFVNLQNFTTNAAALAGGLMPGQLYQNAGVVMVVKGISLPVSPSMFFLWGGQADLTYQSGILPFAGGVGVFGISGHSADFKVSRQHIPLI